MTQFEISDSEFGITDFLKQTCEESITKEYDLSQFKGHYVVRRGNNVYLETPENSEICLKYQGRDPNIEINIVSAENQFTIPETAIPGKYQLFINSEEKNCYFYIIFNSWNSNCPEFFEDEEKRKNFILQESGWIDQGSNSVYRKSGRMWMYNQFDGQVINDIFELIQNYQGLETHEDFEKLTHPSFFTRAITNVIGIRVLQGNWSGNYENGKVPWYWKSSEEIIKNALESGSATKFGQCWVFSAVTVTFCRALGLACRSVTNKGSAHDYGANLEIDYYVDEPDLEDFIKKRRNGEMVDNRGKPGSPFLCGDQCVRRDGEDLSINFHDSIWNFHVWNNVWFSWNGSGE